MNLGWFATRMPSRTTTSENMQPQVSKIRRRLNQLTLNCEPMTYPSMLASGSSNQRARHPTAYSYISHNIEISKISAYLPGKTIPMLA